MLSKKHSFRTFCHLDWHKSWSFQVLPYSKHRGKFSDGTHRNGSRRLERKFRLFHSRGQTIDSIFCFKTSDCQTTKSITSCDMFHFSQGGGPTGMEEVVSHFKKLNGATGWGEWEVDQVQKLPSSFFYGNPGV